MSRGISDNNGGVGRGQGIYDAYEGLETTTEARGIGDRTKESTTTTEASEEEDEHKDYNNYNIGFGGGYTTRPRY